MAVKKYDWYTRKEIYPIEQIIPLIDKSLRNNIVLLAEEPISLCQNRILLFKEKGHKCVSCGISARYFAVEKHKRDLTSKYHINLYAVSRRGEEIMMTQDHIIPKSKGGSNLLQNLQPMCDRCNLAKGNR